MDFATVVPPYVAKPLRLHPFRGLMLSPTRVGDPASARAFARPYRDVPTRLADWEQEGRIIHDPQPALYLHEYTSGGLTVRGLVGALDISHHATSRASRAVWPHEGIHPAQVDELAHRMEQMRVNPAPILLVHDGPPTARTLLSRVVETAPQWDYTDRGGQRQRVWAIREPDTLHALDDALASSTCLIADGHHRYAAYLKLQQDHAGTAWDRGLAMLVDQSDTPLFLGPIHRSLDQVSLPELERTARSLGAHVRELDREHALPELSARTLLAADGRRWATVTPPDDATHLLVEWLHRTLLPAIGEQHQVHYHHSADEALARCERGALAVLMPAPDFPRVVAVVEDGRLLPEKATSFQPKPSIGVLMRSLLDG